MSEPIIIYNQTEKTDTRFVGFVGDAARFDMMIISTEHFYGKKVYICLQSNKSAILNENDLADISLLQEAFALTSVDEARELSEFLLEYV